MTEENLPKLHRAHRTGVIAVAALVVLLLAVVTASSGGDDARLTALDPITGAGTGATGPTETSEGFTAGGTEGDLDAAAGPTGGASEDPSAQEVPEEPGSAAPTTPSGTGATPGPGPGPASPGSPTPAPAPSSQGEAPTGPSDQGVSDTEIVVAYARIDPAFGARFGVSDPHARESIEAYVEAVNAEGGINGRRIRAEIVTNTDPRTPDAGQQVCRAAFADRQAFMLVTDSRTPGTVDCAVRSGRPISDFGLGPTSTTTSGDLAAFGGRYWAMGMSAERIAQLWVAFLASQPEGNGAKIGIVEHYDPQLIAASKAVQAELRAAGFDKPSVYRHTEDTSTAALQVANAMEQFKRDGVTLVLPVTNAVAVGIIQQGFEANGYRPAWSFSPFGQMDATQYTHLYNDSQFNGALGISLARLPSQPGQERCRDIFTKKWPDLEYGSTQAGWCHAILLNAEVLRRTGPQLTLGTWSRSYASLGTYEGPYFPTSTFGPGKFDGADQVQVIRYQDGEMVPAAGFTTSFR